MLSSSSSVRASLSLVPGKNAHEPNLVVVPTGGRAVKLSVEWTMQADDSVVIGSHDPRDGHSWCVLDSDLKQILHGSYSSGAHKGPAKAESVVARTVRGGGAGNPKRIDIELAGSKLEDGAAYTLIASHHGVTASGGFVAVHQPKPKTASKKRKAPARKKAAKKKKK